MARIVHAKEMLKLIRSKEAKTVFVEIEDDILLQNNGVYRLDMTSYGSRVTGMKDKPECCEVWEISQLTSQVLKNVWITEIV